MNRLSLYVTAPPFMHVRRLGEGRPPLGGILLADLADRPATAEELPVALLARPLVPRVRTAEGVVGAPPAATVASHVFRELSLEGGGGGAAAILAAVRERPRPAPMELAEWLADRARCPGLRAPLATLFGRAISGGGRPGLGTTWSETPVTPLGGWSGALWQEVARLADLAANREAMGRLLARRNATATDAVGAISQLLGATEDEFRERAGWEWVLEAAVRQSFDPASATRERVAALAVTIDGARGYAIPTDAGRAATRSPANPSRPVAPVMRP